MSRENLITQFAHSRQVQTVIEDDVFERRLGGLHVFRGISLAHEERLGKSKNIIFFKIIYLDFLFTYFLFIALESLLRDDYDTDSDSTFFEENSIAATPQHSARTAGILNHQNFVVAAGIAIIVYEIQNLGNGEAPLFDGRNTT